MWAACLGQPRGCVPVVSASLLIAPAFILESVPVWAAVLISYCCYSKLAQTWDSKQHKFVILHLCRSGVHMHFWRLWRRTLAFSSMQGRPTSLSSRPLLHLQRQQWLGASLRPLLSFLVRTPCDSTKPTQIIQADLSTKTGWSGTLILLKP